MLKYKKVSDFAKVLSHPSRVMIIEELSQGKKCVNDIQELLEIRQANISQHLTLLRLNGVVDWHQESQQKCYYLKNPQLIKNILKILEEIK